MKTVYVPEGGQNPLIIKINNKTELSFKTGEEYTVDDDVAELILARLNISPEESYKPDPLDAERAAIAGTKEALDEVSDYNPLAQAISEIIDTLVEADVLPEPLYS